MTDGNKSDDSFYDSDQDEQMAAASTQSLFDPCSPYTPVGPKQQPPCLTTLSGRRLSSSVCAEAIQSVKEHLQTQLSPSPAHPTSPTTSFVRASCYFEEAKRKRESLIPSMRNVKGMLKRLFEGSAAVTDGQMHTKQMAQNGAVSDHLEDIVVGSEEEETVRRKKWRLNDDGKENNELDGTTTELERDGKEQLEEVEQNGKGTDAVVEEIGEEVGKADGQNNGTGTDKETADFDLVV